MKTIKKVTILSFLITILWSCSLERRTVNKGYYIKWKTQNKIQIKSNNIINEDSQINFSFNDVATIDNSSDVFLQEINVNKQDTTIYSNQNKVVAQTKVDFRFENQECDVILLKNGDEISCKVTEIGINEVKYKKCDNLNGPLITILKNSIFSITYSNGTKEVFHNEKVNPINNNQFDEKSTINKNSGLAIASLVLSLLGIIASFITASPFVLILFGFLPIILAAIQFSKIRKNPNKYGGKGMANAGFVLGIITSSLFILYYYVISL